LGGYARLTATKGKPEIDEKSHAHASGSGPETGRATRYRGDAFVMGATMLGFVVALGWLADGYDLHQHARPYIPTGGRHAGLINILRRCRAMSRQTGERLDGGRGTDTTLPPSYLRRVGRHGSMSSFIRVLAVALIILGILIGLTGNQPMGSRLAIGFIFPILACLLLWACD
jgi:hypothetical protein